MEITQIKGFIQHHGCQYVLFSLVGAVGLVIFGVLYDMLTGNGWSYDFAVIISTLVQFTYSFPLQKRLVFKCVICGVAAITEQMIVIGAVWCIQLRMNVLLLDWLLSKSTSYMSADAIWHTNVFFDLEWHQIVEYSIYLVISTVNYISATKIFVPKQ